MLCSPVLAVLSSRRRQPQELLKGPGLAVMGRGLHLAVPIPVHLPTGLIPAALAGSAQPSSLPGRSGMVDRATARSVRSSRLTLMWTLDRLEGYTPGAPDKGLASRSVRHHWISRLSARTLRDKLLSMGLSIGKLPRNGRMRVVVVAILLATAIAVTAQNNRLRDNFDEDTGLFRPIPESENDVRIVTTDTVPGMTCKAVSAEDSQFPVMVLPSSGLLGERFLSDGTIRGMKTMRRAAVARDANAIIGFRTDVYMTREENPRVLLYGTLAHCEPPLPPFVGASP